MAEIDRRRFLQGTGAVAAGLALGGCTVPDIGEVGTPDPLDTFDHVVVVMFENRSFDNLLGGLYGSPGAPDPRFDGVFTSGAPGVVSNPSPFGPAPILAGPTTIGTAPTVDPGECWADVNVQLFGGFDPATNRYRDGCPGDGTMTAPWNVPVGRGADMSGFALDYQSAWKVNTGQDATPDDVAQVMQYFTSDVLPVTHGLARSFGLFDSWHCDVPSDTFVNRSFFHAAASTGLVTEPPFAVWPLHNTAPTILSRMAQRGVSWNVFFDPWQVVPLTLLINFRDLWPHIGRFRHIDRFFSAAAAGTLPQYTFIEPRMLTIDPTGHPESDMHPTFFELFGTYTISDVRRGDAFLHQVYDAIRRSPARDRTLLLMCFDEHGGMHDHVPPPAATPPGDGATNQYGFGFDRLGVRVPTLAISSHVPPGTIVSEQMQNTSVMRTLSEKWGLGSLTARDASAPRFDGIIDPAVTRAWPTTTPPAIPDHGPVPTTPRASGLGLAAMQAAAAAAEALPRLRAGQDPEAATRSSAPKSAPSSASPDQLRQVLEQANDTLQAG